MQFERLYHNAASTAEGPADAERGSPSLCSAVALLQNAFPQALEASAYALRKRLVCPRWWLIGVLSQWMSKDLELLIERIGLSEDEFVFSGPALNAKNFPLVVALWTELLAQISADGFEGLTVELNLRRILRGTAAEVYQQREFLTQYLSAALRIQRIKTTTPKSPRSRTKLPQHKGSQLAIESLGLVQIFENVLLSDSDGQKLFITFAKSPRKLFSANLVELLPAVLQAQCKSGVVHRCSSALITLQPDVLQAMSRSLSPKKLIPYLSLEITKSGQKSGGSLEQHELTEGVWRGRDVVSKELTRLHKDELTQSRTLYDHGLLSWENEAPRQRIRAIRRDAGAEGGNASGIVHCWRLSQHVIDAISFEQALTHLLTSEDVIKTNVLSATDTSELPATMTSKVKENVAIESSLDRGAAQVFSQKEFAVTVSTHDLSDSSLVSAYHSSQAVKKHTPLNSSPQPTVNQSSPRKTIEVNLAEKSTAHHQAQKRVVTFTSQRDLQAKDVWSDDDFLMCVAEFYESLTPLQQQAFERERRRMSPEQFKLYVTPALKRFKLSNV